MQNDFVQKSGALYVKGAEQIVGTIEKILNKAKSAKLPIIYTMDWHKEDDDEFKRFNWPKHCVRNTPGAEIVRELAPRQFDGKVVKKLTYDAFSNPRMERLLKELNVNELYIVGVATEYCVKNTALSALRKGYKVVIVVDAVKSVTKEGGKLALDELSNAGAMLKSSEQVVVEL
jgi:nicotinamidase/pyrazinamidase